MANTTNNKIIAKLQAVKCVDLCWNKETKDFEDCFVHPTVMINVDCGAIATVIAEDGKGLVDYYGEFRGGYPYIHPALETFAASHNCAWEWVNPGSIGLYHD